MLRQALVNYIRGIILFPTRILIHQILLGLIDGV
jgi:hypothetical protein